MAFGLLSTGFVRKTFDDIKTEMEEGFESAFGPSVNTTASSILGQQIGIFADQIDQLWEVALAVYSAYYPSSATDSSLDGVGSITGATRLAAASGTVTMTCAGDDTTPLPVGRVVSSSTTSTRWTSLAAGTIDTVATAWAPTTFYNLDDIKENGGNLYIVTAAGTSAGAGGPTGTGSGIVDGTVTWNFLGAGDAYTEIEFEAEDTGPLAGVAGSIDTIETPLSGWAGAINKADALPGRDLESNAAYRLRRLQLLRATGKATVEAIRALLLDVDDVTEAKVFENITLVTDSNGLPGKSIEAVVQGGTAADIGATLWAAKGGGLETFGDITEVITDSQGDSQSMKFSRADELVASIIINLTAKAATYPADGDDQVKAAIAAEGNKGQIGQIAYDTLLQAQAFQVSGVIDVTDFKISTNPPDAPPPTISQDIVPTNRELVTFDTGDIAVNSTLI